MHLQYRRRGADCHEISHRIQIVPNEDSSEKKFSLLIFIISINAILGCSGSEEGIIFHICEEGMLLSYMSLFFTASLCTNLYIPFRGALSPKVHYAVSLYGKQNFISNLRSKDGYIFSCYYSSLFAKMKKLLR